MNVLSLFDGISCGQLALQRAGIEYENYFASEIDKYAIQITQKNFPKTIQLGDVNKYNDWNLPKIDLLIGGSPCQDLSLSKKDRQGLKGEKSKLFYIYVSVLKLVKPKYFLLENVASMPKEAKEEITKILGVEPILINSALVSAQQRKRLYWTNIPGIKQPEDKNISLKDIIISGIPYTNKSQALTATYQKCVFHDSINKHRRTMIAEDMKWCNDKNLEHLMRPFGSKAHIVCIEQEKSPTLIAAMGMGGGNGIYFADKNNLTSNLYRVENGTTYINNKKYNIKLPDGIYSIRKLTPTECERLQTLPDNYTEGVSNSQRYKTIGNGWTVDVIAHIFKNIPEEIK